MYWLMYWEDERIHFSSFSVFHRQDSEGMLDFLPGDRFKFITVTIKDNPVPELDKIFRVELYNADGGGEKFEPKITMVKLKILFSLVWMTLLELIFTVFFIQYICIRNLSLAISELNWSCLLPYCFCVFCVLCSCVLPNTNLLTWLLTDTPSHLPFDRHSSGVILNWCDTCLILVCDPSVDQFLRGEGSGSGESDSDFLLPSYHHHGKYPPPLLPKLLAVSIPSPPHPYHFSLPKVVYLNVKFY